MIFINEKTIFIKGNIFTNIALDHTSLFSDNGITIHSKRDVFLGIIVKPNRMRSDDFYLDYEEFLKEYPQGIYDIIGFSKI